jgi:hypothetical protein
LAFPSATRARESSPSDDTEAVALPRVRAVSSKTTRTKAAPNADNPASEPDDDNVRIAPTNTGARTSCAGRQEALTDVAPHGIDSDGSDDGVRATATSRPATCAAARMDAPATSHRTNVKGLTTSTVCGQK